MYCTNEWTEETNVRKRTSFVKVIMRLSFLPFILFYHFYSLTDLSLYKSVGGREKNRLLISAQMMTETNKSSIPGFILLMRSQGCLISKQSLWDKECNFGDNNRTTHESFIRCCSNVWTERMLMMMESKRIERIEQVCPQGQSLHAIIVPNGFLVDRE